ncbi:MAG: hypothetical protein GXO63_03265, partial [Candidatus Micrarchaeota archaeon]|nr:hypothetical protein [Candidatus Micrarchaeota archaeon]
MGRGREVMYRISKGEINRKYLFPQLWDRGIYLPPSANPEEVLRFLDLGILLDGELHRRDEILEETGKDKGEILSILTRAGVLESYIKTRVVRLSDEETDGKVKGKYENAIIESLKGQELTIRQLAAEAGRRIDEEPFPNEPIPKPFDRDVNRKYREFIDALQRLERDGIVEFDRVYAKLESYTGPKLTKESIDIERDLTPEARKILQ